MITHAPARPAALAALTESELAVIDRRLAGASMRAIATERGVAYRTVAKQIASAYDKLGVSSREELVARVHALAEPSGRRR